MDVKIFKIYRQYHRVLLIKDNNFSANNCLFAVSKLCILLQQLIK